MEDMADAKDFLEYGLSLMRKRQQLEALASWFTNDADRAGAAVRCTLCEAWWSRRLRDDDANLDLLLLADLRDKVASPLRGCEPRAMLCARTEVYQSLDAEGEAEVSEDSPAVEVD